MFNRILRILAASCYGMDMLSSEFLQSRLMCTPLSFSIEKIYMCSWLWGTILGLVIVIQLSVAQINGWGTRRRRLRCLYGLSRLLGLDSSMWRGNLGSLQKSWSSENTILGLIAMFCLQKPKWSDNAFSVMVFLNWHLDKVESCKHFRCLYLSYLGCWDFAPLCLIYTTTWFMMLLSVIGLSVMVQYYDINANGHS